MSTASGGTIFVRVEGKDVGLTDLLAKINSTMAAGQGTIRNYTAAMAQLDPATKMAEIDLAKYAQSLATVAQKSGDSAAAIRILGNALQNDLTAGTTSANLVQAQLQGYLNQSAEAATKAHIGIQSFAVGLIGLQGGFQVATRVIREFNEVINAGNELEKTLTSFRVLSGSTEQYQHNLAAAREQQSLFGGSLQNTVEGMTEFANLSNRTGIEITKLTHLARALATVDPAQGFKGAGIALKEFFSGNITSLSRRFEIPREVLNNLQEITDKKEQFDALVKTLEEFGISEELVAAQSKTVAVSFDKLSGSTADAKANIGQALAALSAPFAETVANRLNQINQGFTNIRQLFDQTAQAAQVNQAVFGQTQGFDAYSAKIQQINADLPPYVQKIQELTPAQYAFAQSLVATGNSTDQALVKIKEFQSLVDQTSDKFQRSIFLYNASSQALQDFSRAQLDAANSSKEGAVFALAVADAVANNRITLEQGTAALIQNSTALQAEALAAANSAASIEAHNQALNASAIEHLNTAQASDQLKARQEALLNVLQLVASGSLSQANAESILASQYGVTAAQLPGLISLTYQLAAARQAEVAASNAVNTASANETIARNRAAGRIGRGDSISEIAGITQAAERQAKALDAAEKNRIKTVGTAAQQRALLNSELQNAVKLYGANSAAAINAGTALEKFEDQQAKAAARGAKNPKLSANERLNTQLLDQQDKFNNKFEDAEQTHYDRLADIYEAYAEKQNEQFRKNEVSKRRSRADFYSNLQDAKGIDANKFAAEYEEAFKKAQEIAQSGSAKLAADFLELRQKQIEEMQQLAEDEANVAERRKKGKISKKDADAEIAAIEGRKKLIQDAQDEEQKQLLAAGDENQKALQEQLDKENEAYANQTDKILTQAERAAQGKITHAERSKIAVDAENKSLAEQENIYARIANRTGGKVPGINQPVTTQQQPPIPATTDEEKPVNIKTADGASIPVTTQDEGLLIRQTDPFIVRDTDLSSVLNDIGGRLETRLGQVIESVNNANNSISGAVRAVESAVGRIKLSSPSIVQG